MAGYQNDELLNGNTRNGTPDCVHLNGHDSVHEKGEANKIQFVAKPGRFICRGIYDDVVHLYAENGHLIWIEPQSSMRVLFTYGDTRCDFLCYLEPEVPGVSITSLGDEGIVAQRKQNRIQHRIEPFHSGLASSFGGSTGRRYSCYRTLLSPYSYAVDSVNGQCIIELRALSTNQLKDVKEPIIRPFKLNFQLVL
ncbi:hypothetical protein FGIG_04848 [Fasciola gigantica]|uniref:Uncharacterized protein n=1 Tax=Fasciola gigantica TaxID=46835 RepID=A0A504YDN4_FASGI|nr:hypothetical protein FGIG_04848 [Fasciola gigantica]